MIVNFLISSGQVDLINLFFQILVKCSWGWYFWFENIRPMDFSQKLFGPGT